MSSTKNIAAELENDELIEACVLNSRHQRSDLYREWRRLKTCHRKPLNRQRASAPGEAFPQEPSKSPISRDSSHLRSFYTGIAKITLSKEFLPSLSSQKVYNVIGN